MREVVEVSYDIDRVFGALTVGRYNTDQEFTSARGSVDYKVKYRSSV